MTDQLVYQTGLECQMGYQMASLSADLSLSIMIT